MERAAELVRAILNGEYSYGRVLASKQEHAVLVSNAFIVLFTAFNDRFDRTRFLQACGLVEATSKRKRSA